MLLLWCLMTTENKVGESRAKNENERLNGWMDVEYSACANILHLGTSGYSLLG